VDALSVELPEAYIFAKQMNQELVGKQVARFSLQNCAKYQDMGFFNLYLADYERLCGCRIESVLSRGNTIQIKFDGELNLLLAPEYGGIVLFHAEGDVVPSKYHFRLLFTDETSLTVALTGMGIIQAHTDDELEQSYLYKRDFSSVASPVEEDFTFERFSEELSGKGVNLKTAIVGKNAVIVGLGNAAFQDILFQAGINPKRKASELSSIEVRSLFNAIRYVVDQRIKFGGKNQFVDLYGDRGNYIPSMGPNMKGKICNVCGSNVEKLSIGGGDVYFCAICQR
jgi:formamidopyrimidine-DNA glycosylase